MTPINLAFAFTAGLLATVNPCGWAMLPSFLSYYLGTREAGYEQKPLAGRAVDGLLLGLLVTAGFLTVFGTAAVVLSAGLRLIVKWLPVASLAVGAGLVLLGLWLLRGKSLPIRLPQPEIDTYARSPKSIFLYGVAYGLASLSCTLPVFLSVVSASLAAAGVAGLALMFGAYAGGMATVLVSVAIGAALFKGAIAQWFRPFLPHMHKVGAILLALAGLYLIWYQGRFLPLILAGF
ncbi:MAG: cytochrome c biogenesis protein CcdA [Chloroflexi bacterium]|nr:cytochrome c biogenesis protein CcdA [Chloroflexota bacterium]MCI0575040.1 cytochrome c biogenesis protein CcdA [Chloroflexota bacterium]MCI0645125.1 cytochrome c biogenesis protein CcdA [Chloroflexota bacterium]MCI0726792.1 cytochrome c biogenesis protein CcdA [Chloroflexota bacterium]